MAKISLKNFIEYSLTPDRSKASFIKKLFSTKQGGPDFWQLFKSGLKLFFVNGEQNPDTIKQYITIESLPVQQRKAYSIALSSFEVFYKQFLKGKKVEYCDDPLNLYWHYRGVFVSLGLSLALVIDDKKTYIKFIYFPKKKFEKRDAYPFLYLINSTYSSENDPISMLVKLENGQFYSNELVKGSELVKYKKFLESQCESILSVVKRRDKVLIGQKK